MLAKCVSAKQQLKTECFLCPKFTYVSVAFSISTGLLKRTPGFVAQKLLEMSQRCLKIPLLVCNNATTIPSTCWYKRWLISIKCERDMPQLVHMLTLDASVVCTGVTANITSSRRCCVITWNNTCCRNVDVIHVKHTNLTHLWFCRKKYNAELCTNEASVMCCQDVKQRSWERTHVWYTSWQTWGHHHDTVMSHMLCATWKKATQKKMLVDIISGLACKSLSVVLLECISVDQLSRNSPCLHQFTSSHFPKWFQPNCLKSSYPVPGFCLHSVTLAVSIISTTSKLLIQFAWCINSNIQSTQCENCCTGSRYESLPAEFIVCFISCFMTLWGQAFDLLCLFSSGFVEILDTCEWRKFPRRIFTLSQHLLKNMFISITRYCFFFFSIPLCQRHVYIRIWTPSMGRTEWASVRHLWRERATERN